MKEKSHKPTLKKEAIIGSINHAELHGDYYTVGMSLMNIFSVIQDCYGDQADNLIGQALAISKNNNTFSIKGDSLKKLQSKLQSED